MRNRLKALAFFNRWDKPHLYLAGFFAVALLLSQTLLLQESSRLYLSKVDKIEGEAVALDIPINPDNSIVFNDKTQVAGSVKKERKSKIVVVKLLKPEKAAGVYLKLNGQKVSGFALGETAVNVFEGDYLEIDATCLEEQGVFSIYIPGGGVEFPEDGRIISGRGAVLPVGKVKFKA